MKTISLIRFGLRTPIIRQPLQGLHFTTVVDGCNVAYYGQNKEGGKFEISQVSPRGNQSLACAVVGYDNTQIKTYLCTARSNLGVSFFKCFHASRKAMVASCTAGRGNDGRIWSLNPLATARSLFFTRGKFCQNLPPT